MTEQRAMTYIRSASPAGNPATDEGIARQERQVVEWLGARSEIEVVHAFRDLGVNGMTPMELRPEGVSLLQAARDGEVEVLVISGLDRLGRNTPAALGVRDELVRLGVQVVDTLAADEDLPHTLLTAIRASEYRRLRGRHVALRCPDCDSSFQVSAADL